ncbi:MAG: septal ring lytic transglycosylase RlpA family protein [Bacteroidota bacterium]
MVFIHTHIRFVVAAVLMVFVGLGCASSPRFVKQRSSEPAAGSVSVAPSSSPSRPAVSEGIASYYAHDFHGKKTANGEIFNMRALTAAHRSYPFNTKMRVTNLDNGRTVIVRVNDRGPFKLERITDLSLGAAEALDMTKTGTAKVRLEVLEWGKE